jgi:hypothetical protein
LNGGKRKAHAPSQKTAMNRICLASYPAHKD